MAELQTGSETAYHDQIRRLQTALLNSSSWQTRNSVFPVRHDTNSWPERRENAEEGFTSRQQQQQQQHRPQPAGTTHPRMLSERSVNEDSRVSGAQKKHGASPCLFTPATSPLALFSSTVASTHPFDDLIAKAWGEGHAERNGVCCTRDARAAVPSAVANSSRAPSSSPSATVSVSSTTSPPLAALNDAREPTLRAPAKAAHGNSVKTCCLQATEGFKGEEASSLQEGASLTRNVRPGRVADSRCRVTSIVAACPPARQDDGAHEPAMTRHTNASAEPTEYYTVPSFSKITTATNGASRRGTTRVVSASLNAQPTGSALHSSTMQGACALPDTSVVGSSGSSVVPGRTAHLTVPQQQRLLSRIQLLDRVLESGRSGKGSVQTAQLLRLVKDDNNKPYFEATAVNWAAVRRLRDEFVCELLGTPPAGGRAAHSRPSSHVPCKRAPPSQASPNVESREVSPSAWGGSEDWGVRASTTPSMLRNVSASPSPGHASREASVDAGAMDHPPPCSVERSVQASVESTDHYAESKAAFQRESVAMRRAQERLLLLRRQPPPS